MNNILVITVLYNQTLEQTNVYKTLLKGCTDVFIYDNSPQPRGGATFPERWQYISDPSNPGLSAAYNMGARYAAEHGIGWILLTDQDTIFPPHALDAYSASVSSISETGMIIPQVITTDNRYLSPVKSHGYMTRLVKSAPIGRIDLRKYAVINSGICVRTSHFIKCGGYNERVYLDFSDFQFIEKFAKTFPDAWVLDIKCTQCFSDITDDIGTKLVRFRRFCKSLKGYESSRRFGKVRIAGVVLKRAVSLCIASRSFTPLGIFVDNYIR